MESVSPFVGRVDVELPDDFVASSKDADEHVERETELANGKTQVDFVSPNKALTTKGVKRLHLLKGAKSEAAKCISRRVMRRMMTRGRRNYLKVNPDMSTPARFSFPGRISSASVKPSIERSLEEFVRRKLGAIIAAMPEGRRTITYADVKRVCETEDFKFRELVELVPRRERKKKVVPPMNEKGGEEEVKQDK